MSTIEKLWITPVVAEGMLGKNPGNRRIRPTHVDMLAGALATGAWDRRAICLIQVDRDGNLVDGQHRLLAVIRSRVPIEAHVATIDASIADTEAGAMGVVVDVSARRGVSDILGKPRAAVSAVTVMSSHVTGPNLSPEHVARVLRARPELEYLAEIAPSRRRHVCAAPVFSGFVLRMWRHQALAHDIACQYRAMTLADYAAMWPAVQALNRQLVEGKDARSLRRHSPIATLARSWVASRPGADGSRITVRDETIDAVREEIAEFLRPASATSVLAG